MGHRYTYGRRAAVWALLVVLCIGMAPALAVAGESEEPRYSVRNLFKTFSYQALSAADDFLFGLMFGGGVAAGGILLATSLTTEPFIYYVHESTWSTLAPRTGAAELELVPAKTVTFTMANMGRVFATGWLLTGSPAVAAGFVAFNAFGDAAAYALNDVAWAYFSPIPDPPPDPGAIAKAE